MAESGKPRTSGQGAVTSPSRHMGINMPNAKADDAPRSFPFTWKDEALRPFVLPSQIPHRWKSGDVVWLMEDAISGDKSRRHMFAWLRSAWSHLPEEYGDVYLTPEHLRKAALIAAGWCRETVVEAGTSRRADAIAAAMHGMDEFAIVFVRDEYVICRRAKSQAKAAMSADEFNASKRAIMEIIANMIGVAESEIGDQSGQ